MRLRSHQQTSSRGITAPHHRGSRHSLSALVTFVPLVALILISLLITACGAKTTFLDDWYFDGGVVDIDAGDADSSDADTHRPDTDADTNPHDTDPDSDPDPDTDPDTDPDPDRPVDIRERLEAIEGMTVTELPFGPDGARFFELYFVQPADHDDPEGQTFRQFMTLVHRSETVPLILLSTGYENYYYDYEDELTLLLRANQLVLEHRFFGDSRPEPTDWSLLNIEQSAADTHRIVEALRSLYPAPWVSTGASKGGMTSIYHRRFYPDDVVATVAYVAPISFGDPDERYISFVDGVGGASYSWCRERLTATQIEALQRREAMEWRVEELADYLDLSFDLIGGAEASLESVVRSIPFTFWQYYGVEYCDWVPTEDASDDELFEFLDYFGGFESDDDWELLRYLPYYYQAETELGFPALREDHIEDFLQADEFDLEELLPGVPIDYDPRVMEDIAAWVDDSGSELMFIYGEHDPWTAGAFELGGADDSFFYVENEGTHYASIGGLRRVDRNAAYDVLERWTGVTPWSAPAPAPRRPARPLFEPRLRFLPPMPW